MDPAAVNALGLLAAGLFFAALGAASWAGWRWFRRARGRWEATLEALRTQGFTPADDPGIAERLRSPGSTAGAPAPRLLTRPGAGFTEWVVCAPPGTTGPPTAVAIQSDQLALPRFVLLPAVPNGEGRGYGSDAHLHEILSPDTPEVRYPPVRVSGTAHTVSGDRAGEVESSFSAGFRAWLRTTEGLALRGDGDLLVVWLGPRHPGWAPLLEVDPIRGLALARDACDRLRRRNDAIS